MLLILAGISLSGLFSEKGIFSRTEQASNKYNEAKARETLETVLLADAQYEKHSNPKYDQDEFLNELIVKEIPGSEIRGDVAILGDYAYELDRSVPKIGKYLGNPKDLVWPDVNANVELAPDKETATISITATTEDKDGIERIEIWLKGQLVDTIPGNKQGTMTTTYEVEKNGTYTIRAYGQIAGSTVAKVEGIEPPIEIEFSPNGDTNWKKEHSTTIKVKGKLENVVGMKYAWAKSDVQEPAESEFVQECSNNSTITGKDMTGTYYLWITTEAITGKKYKSVSQGFNFDNEGPTITSVTVDKYSADGIKLNIKAKDSISGIDKLEFYIDDKYIGNKECSVSKEITEDKTITGLSMGKHSCLIYAYDKAGNYVTKSKSGTTKMHTWSLWNVITEFEFSEVLEGRYRWPLKTIHDLFNVRVTCSDYYTLDPKSGWILTRTDDGLVTDLLWMLGNSERSAGLARWKIIQVNRRPTYTAACIPNLVRGT